MVNMWLYPQCGRPRFDPWVGKIPWRRKWQPTPVFLPGEFHGWRSLVGCSPWGLKESETTERLQFHPEKSFCSEAFSMVFLLSIGRIILPEIKGH